MTSLLEKIEGVAEKVGTFIVREIQSAETLLGAKTGNQKLNLVVTAVETGLSSLGINVAGYTADLTLAVNALVAFLNKIGALPASTGTIATPAPGTPPKNTASATPAAQPGK